ncbi:MAG: signal peptide peptidase SppA [Bacteroidales bacterium]
MFYKKALEKLGIEVQVVKHGKYKGAVEPFTGNELSPENRSQIERFTAGIWGNMLSEISESRGIPVTDLNRIADELTTTSIDRAMELGMIDSLVYRDQLNDMLESLSGAEPELVSMYKYKTVPVDSNSEKNGKIALLYAEGNIVMGKGNESNIGGDFYASVIRKIRESGTYDAMVIRLNSPGGNAMASDLIWREISLAAEEMPVVVSMSDYAASGGYYISAPATKILAHANTITGSIGVFGMIPQAGKLLENRLGITTESVKTNRFSDSPSLFRAMEPAERITMQVSVDKTYDDFIGKVALGRNILKEEVDQMGEGQVYAGTDALEKGLIDAIGGMADAMEEASTLAGITGYRVVEFPTYEDPYSRILKSLSGEIKTSY